MAAMLALSQRLASGPAPSLTPSSSSFCWSLVMLHLLLHTGHGGEHVGSNAGAESAPGLRSSTQPYAF